jgi:hypothetical protein
VDKLVILTTQESTNSETDVLSIGAFARYYFLELDSKRFKAYGEAIGLGFEETHFGAFEDKSNSVTADINEFKLLYY